MDSRRGTLQKKDDDDDRRMVCRYGTKCYQKNPAHLRKFKHPSKNREKPEPDSSNKKRKSPPEKDRSNEPKAKKASVSSESEKESDTKCENVKNKVEESESDSKNETTKMDVDSELPKVDSASEKSKTEDQKDSEKVEKEDDKKEDEEDKTVVAKNETSESNDKSETSNDSNKTETIESVKKVEPLKNNDKKDDASKTDNKIESSKLEKESPKEEKTSPTKIEKETPKEEKEPPTKVEKETPKEGKEPPTKVEKKSLTEVEKESPTKVEKESPTKVEKESPTKVEKESPIKVEKESPKPVNQTLTKVESSKPTVKTPISPKPQVKTVTSKVITDPHIEARALINKIFLVGMPDDFYKFYDFCRELKPSDPSTAFKIADIKLVGPYDVLTGLITKNTPNPENLLAHWRYYYDPPEFQTILKGNDREGLHFGYWRDRPSSDPAFVATNSSNVSHKIKPVAENIFGAIAGYLEERTKKANPFEKTGFFNLLGKLKAYAKKYNITLEPQTAKMKQREKNVVARTIHGAGVVCPYNKKSQLGYRELSVTDNQLLKIVKRIDDAKDDIEREAPRAELGEVVRLATIAGDECDFGTCLELGHDLLSTGCSYVQNAALAVLSIAYNQLERQAFLKIVEIHMKDRKKGCNTSALNLPKEKC